MVCSDAKQRVRCKKQRKATAPVQSVVKLQPWFLSLRWKTCLLQNFSLGSCACCEGPALGRTLMMRARLHLRSLAPIWYDFFYDYDGQWHPGKDGASVFPIFVLQLRKTPGLKQQPGKLSDLGSNPGPQGERQRCYPSTSAVVHLIEVEKCRIWHLYTTSKRTGRSVKLWTNW